MHLLIRHRPVEPAFLVLDVPVERGDRRIDQLGHLKVPTTRSIDTAMPGSDTHGWRSTHHTSTVGFTVDLSSSAPAFTATMPGDDASSDTIGEPHDPQKRRRT